MALKREGAIVFETVGAFYNPKMMLCRDIGVAMISALGIDEYLDALSASGIRGMRVAREAGTERVTLNDFDPRAVQLMQRNVARNDLDCIITEKDANVLMHQEHFQAIDLDPFGSPSPYLSAASRSARSYLFITATDTAPLCGAHLKSGIRKYMARPLRTDYHREMGARILLGLAARELARWDKGTEPLLTHVTDHYVRIYLRLIRGADAADSSLHSLGYVEHCNLCGSFEPLAQPRPAGVCPHCRSPTTLAGPLWLGSIQEPAVIRSALEGGDLSNRAEKILATCSEEVDVPMYYDHHRICEKLRITPGRIDDIISGLRSLGHKASRTHFTGLGIKTDATLPQLEEVLRDNNH
ncbi:MAG: tRNA (guanine(10)-N(2))-dimethyltransferase [Methanothrix sp.]|uniref:tRNA (guanine(10)-N(2))-dimethyltransferase n=1 Tax=Methanothrix sp. TaxID=90426 RepID=UPI0025F6DBFE|nr:tRNA (guanine(10)-N(2))-dimethyltransferase [Methanothrix sp.]MBK7385985.1 tRNA (guanine(10)-N(2))-dimethyltransferase [Methanothrix sp.]